MPRRSEAFRQPAWELHDATERDDLKTAIFAAASLLPDDLRIPWTGDIEIIGSDAYGVANDGSDVDLVFVVPDYRATELWRDSIRRRSTDCRNIKDEMHRIGDLFGVRLDWGMGPSAKGLICYSLLEEKWYGREAGTPVETRVEYDVAQGKFSFVPYTPHLYFCTEKA